MNVGVIIMLSFFLVFILGVLLPAALSLCVESWRDLAKTIRGDG